ncbi:MAG: hypothetical protein QG564_88 [Campylobacterota bacterium]|nr:hypothetical protein [Campylobacterota bacterium]
MIKYFKKRDGINEVYNCYGKISGFHLYGEQE